MTAYTPFSRATPVAPGGFPTLLFPLLLRALCGFYRIYYSHRDHRGITWVHRPKSWLHNRWLGAAEGLSSRMDAGKESSRRVPPAKAAYFRCTRSETDPIQRQSFVVGRLERLLWRHGAPSYRFATPTPGRRRGHPWWSPATKAKRSYSTFTGNARGTR